MPRYQKYHPLYEATSRFIQNCLLEDRSLLWPEHRLWTMKNLAEIRQRFVEGEVTGEDKFDKKVQQQFSGAVPELWAVWADVLYVYYLTSNSIKFETKKKAIRQAAEQAQLSLPTDNDPVWQALNHGFITTSRQYNLKFPQIRLLILFASGLKSGKYPLSALNSSHEFQIILDQTIKDTPKGYSLGKDFRHALLYMAFPDEYEPIISETDRVKIVERFREQVPGSISSDTDQTLHQIREALAPQYDTSNGPFHFYDPPLKSEWKNEDSSEGRGNEDDPEAPDGLSEVREIRGILEHTHNLILYGPPGTGKTYLARKAAFSIIEPQLSQPVSDAELHRQVIEDLPVYQILALAMYTSGEDQAYTVPSLHEHPFVKTRFFDKPVGYPREAIWGNLQTHARSDSETVRTKLRVGPELFDKVRAGKSKTQKAQEALWKLTEDGIDFVKESLADRLALLKNNTKPVFTAEQFIQTITFHQSYSYEDFIEGFRPVPGETDDEPVKLTLAPGAFRRFCTKAVSDTDNKYVLIIDEINRGNIAKIMGELITLIEDDKRSDQPNALSPLLPYSKDRFFVPKNLIILGTMNTSDRSIALLDVALRRRFAFMEIMPDPSLLAEVDVEAGGQTVNLGELLAGLNKRITEHIDRNHQIGHSYFLRVKEAPEAERMSVLEFVWNQQIIPLLQEYYYSRPDELQNLLKPFKSNGASLGTARGSDLVTMLKQMEIQN